MKPFNLEEYLKNPSRKVVTRDGRPVRIICTDRKGATPIIALVNDGLSEELGHAFYSDGKIFSLITAVRICLGVLLYLDIVMLVNCWLVKKWLVLLDTCLL